MSNLTSLDIEPNKRQQQIMADLRIAVGWGAIESDKLSKEERHRLKAAQKTMSEISALEVVPILIMLTGNDAIPIRAPAPIRDENL